jgi:uncharacterized protein YndB with AHSA1/START domain
MTWNNTLDQVSARGVPMPGVSASTPARGATPSIIKTTLVRGSQRQAFDLFTLGQARWWPAVNLPAPAPMVFMESRLGGRWYERSADYNETTWGRVLAWMPPQKLVLSWQIDADGEFDPQLETELELGFTARSDRLTLVSLEHRHLDRYGDEAESQRSLLASDVGWAGILERFAQQCGRLHAPG